MAQENFCFMHEEISDLIGILDDRDPYSIAPEVEIPPIPRLPEDKAYDALTDDVNQYTVVMRVMAVPGQKTWYSHIVWDNFARIESVAGAVRDICASYSTDSYEEALKWHFKAVEWLKRW